MKKLFTLFLLLTAGTAIWAQNAPEILYYKFDGTGTSVPNDAINPPTGTNTASIVGSLSQGSTGLCGGALIGVGGSSSSNYVNTGWNTNLGNSPWTIMFWTNNIPSSSTLFYQFGDASASSFRCFTNGVAGAGNWWLRGPVTDVPCNGCAPTGAVPSMTAFVYDPTLGNIKAYHNGVLNNTVNQSTLSISGASFTVGGQGGSTGMASGQLMDEFRFYDRPLDATEIALVWNQCLPLTFAPNDAAITTINEPSNFCSDTLPVVVTLKNAGTDQLTSAIINWEIDGVAQTPVNYSGLLDTLNGTGPDDTLITLGTWFFAPNTPYDIKVWSSMPNGVADTVNYNDTSAVTVQAAIAGTFQIGGAGADYPNFAAAINDLNAFGICGPVVFNVYDSTYIEQISLADIDGTSATNTITFQPISGTPEIIWAAFSSTENYTVAFRGADWVSFNGIYVRNDGTTYGRVLEVSGGSHHNNFENCWFVGDTTPTTTSTNMCVLYSASDIDSNNTFRSNVFRGGSYGAYWYGSSTTALEPGTVFDRNDYVDNYYYGARLYYQDGPKFTWNDFIGNTPYTGSVSRFYFVYCDNDLLVANNTATGDYYGYGIYLSSCDGTSAQPGKVYNNMIRIGNSQTTSTSYGLYMATCGFQEIYHNSFHVTTNGTSSRSAYITSGGGSIMRNNIFSMDGPGYGIYLNSQYSLTSSDYNDIYAPNGSVGYFNANQTTLANYQAATGMEANSISVNPNFYSDDDLHVCQDSLDGQGEKGWGPWDIDSQPRDPNTPDIGADEFTPISTFTLGNDTALCTGDTLILSSGAAPSDTVLWNTGATTSVLEVTTPGTYSVSINGACGSASDQIVVTQSAINYTGFLVSDTNNLCEGDTVTLSSNQTADTYAWSPGGATTSTLEVTASGTYTLDIADNCGTGSESLTINFNSAPQAGFTTITSFLTGSFTFTGSTSGNSTFDWDFGDGNGTSAQQDPIYLYGQDGSYVVTLTVTNDCGTSTFSDTILISSVGMEEDLLNNAIGIYPNPSQGTFNVDIDLAGANEYQIVVRDLQGRALYTTDKETVYGATVREFDLSQAAKGLYFVEIAVNDHKVLKKLVIE